MLPPSPLSTLTESTKVSPIKEEKEEVVAATTPVKTSAKKKPARMSKSDKDLTICHTLLSELGGHEEAWPFLTPVNTKQFPTYKKIIKNPMDVSTIRKKLHDGM